MGTRGLSDGGPGPDKSKVAPPPPPLARPLIPLTLALALGVASSAWEMRLPGPALAVACAVLFSFLVWTGLTGRGARLVPLALFWFLGLALARQALNPVLPAHHVVRLPQGQELTLKGRLYMPAQIQEGRVRLFLEASHGLGPHGWQPVSGKVLLTGSGHSWLPSEGTEVVVRTALRKPRDLLNPGAFPRCRYLAAKGIFREGRLRGPADLVVLSSGKPPGTRDRLRQGFRDLLAPMDQVSRALYLALVLGDQGEVGREMRLAFSRTGTSHLLAISGLHLGSLAGLGFLAIFWLLRRFPRILLQVNAIKLATVLAAIPVVTYAWIAGGSPATQRAEIMILAYLFLVLAGRPRELLSALALAAMLMLILSPLLLFSLSFQLSFISVAALAYLLPRLVTRPDPEASDLGLAKKWGRRVFFWFKGALSASGVATLATAPLVAASFHTVSLLGIIVNLVAIPLLNGLAVPLGLLAVAAQAIKLTPLAQGCLSLGQIPLMGAYAAISWAAGLPGGALTLPTPSWLQTGLYYGAALLIFHPKRTKFTGFAGVLAAILLAGTIIMPVGRASQTLELTLLDSPAGLAGVLITPDDQRLVISGGWPAWPGREAGSVGPLTEYLHWRQFRQLDKLLGLSLTSQNAPELLRLAQEFRLREAWLADGISGPEVIQLRNFLGDQGYPVRNLRRSEAPIVLGAVRLRCFALEGGRGAGLKISFAGQQVLVLPPVRLTVAAFPGVASEEPLEALVIPHPPDPEWLAALQPRQVIVYGTSGRTGQSFPVPGLFYTREGAVTLQLSGKRAVVSQFRGGSPAE